MPIGDGTDATAGGMAVVLGTALRNTVHTLITATRDYIANGPAYWKSGVTVPLTKGGHGATTAAGARTALSVPSTTEAVLQTQLAAPDFATASKVPVYNAAGQLTSVAPSLGGHVVPLSTLQGGHTCYGEIYLPNSSAAVSGYTIAYINSDGRISRGASSERYKKYIRAIEPAEVGDLFPQLHRFQMRSLDGTGDGVWRYGYIAERLAEHPDQAVFVVYDRDGRPDSIDFIGLLLAQVAQLHQREEERDTIIENLLDRVETLENAR